MWSECSHGPGLKQLISVRKLDESKDTKMCCLIWDISDHSIICKVQDHAAITPKHLASDYFKLKKKIHRSPDLTVLLILSHSMKGESVEHSFPEGWEFWAVFSVWWGDRKKKSYKYILMTTAFRVRTSYAKEGNGYTHIHIYSSYLCVSVSFLCIFFTHMYSHTHIHTHVSGIWVVNKYGIVCVCGLYISFYK